MNLSLILPNSFRRNLLLIGVGLVVALGCSGPSTPVQTDVAVETTSCVDGALSMTFTVASTNGMFPPTYQFGSPNVVGTPTMTPGTNSFSVMADVDTLTVGEAVSMNFGVNAFQPASISVQNIQYYTVPASQLPQPSSCPPTHGPVIGTNDLPGLGLHLEVSNPTPDPIILQSLELVESPTVLSSSDMEWGNPTLESLPWAMPIAPGTVMPPGAPSLVIDLPDSPSLSTQATLLRYTAVAGGSLQRVIAQADLFSGPIRTEQTTWGKVKSLYGGK